MIDNLKKRQYLISHADQILEWLSYYKTWAPFMRSKPRKAIWRWGEAKSETKIHEAT